MLREHIPESLFGRSHDEATITLMEKVGDLILESKSSEHVPNNSLGFEFEEQVKWFKFRSRLAGGTAVTIFPPVL